MDKSIILLVVGYILYLVITFGMPLRQKKLLKNAGDIIYSFSRSDKIKTVLIYIFSFILISLVSVKFFSFSAKIILEFCAICGLYISARENNFTTVSGLYKNGIICSEGYFVFDDILTLPILNLSEKEQDNYSKNVLVIATKSKGNVEIVFDDEFICEKATEELIKVCPRLNS